MQIRSDTIPQFMYINPPLLAVIHAAAINFLLGFFHFLL